MERTNPGTYRESRDHHGVTLDRADGWRRAGGDCLVNTAKGRPDPSRADGSTTDDGRAGPGDDGGVRDGH